MATIDAGNIGTADRIFARILDTRARAKTGTTRIIEARRSGMVKTWKTRPGEFRAPYKYGMYESFYLTEANAHCWHDSAASAAGGLVWRNPGDSMPMVETRPVLAALASPQPAAAAAAAAAQSAADGATLARIAAEEPAIASILADLAPKH